jgi:hypothetical protein
MKEEKNDGERKTEERREWDRKSTGGEGRIGVQLGGLR